MSNADCKKEANLVPIIDTRRCEGKEDCVRVCPFSVFEVRKLTQEELGALSFFVRFKVKVHGSKQAFVTKPEACESCGLCVKACPEKAIKLEKRADAARS
jgi:NAD-dependent dihydropyrimidine dehydrogenase PreA subunit